MPRRKLTNCLCELLIGFLAIYFPMNSDSSNPFLGLGMNDSYVLVPPPAFDPFASTPAPQAARNVQSQPQIVIQSPPLISNTTTISHFSGYMHEDGRRFLAEFESYISLSGIELASPRVVAAFHLNLKGPARIWFNNLTCKETWEQVKRAFIEEYCDRLESPTLIAETVAFDNLVLQPTQTIEEFHSIILEKGKKLKKSETDMILKFINSLPAQLAFFVRAGKVSSYREALQSAKIGEAHGYRQSNPLPVSSSSVNAAHANKDSMQLQIDAINKRLDQLYFPVAEQPTEQDKKPTRGSGTRTTRSGNLDNTRNQNSRSRSCYKCSGHGHMQRYCNWTGQGDRSLSTVCQLCAQNGHAASNCKTLQSRQQSSDINGKCQLCQGQDHVASNCPSLNQGGLGPVRNSQA